MNILSEDACNSLKAITHTWTIPRDQRLKCQWHQTISDGWRWSYTPFAKSDNTLIITFAGAIHIRCNTQEDSGSSLYIMDIIYTPSKTRMRNFKGRFKPFLTLYAHFLIMLYNLKNAHIVCSYHRLVRFALAKFLAEKHTEHVWWHHMFPLPCTLFYFEKWYSEINWNIIVIPASLFSMISFTIFHRWYVINGKYLQLMSPFVQGLGMTYIHNSLLPSPPPPPPGAYAGGSNTPLWIHFFSLLACLLNCQRGWWFRRIPLPHVWKIDKKVRGRKKKKCHSPPPLQRSVTILRASAASQPCNVKTPPLKKYCVLCH